MTPNREVRAIEELIERVEKATGPDRGIDALVANECKALDAKHFGMWYGLRPKGSVSTYLDFCKSGAAAKYTSSLDAVVGLIERELPKWGWQISVSENGAHPIGKLFCSYPINRNEYGEAATATLSLLLAFLRALRAPQQEKSQ